MITVNRSALVTGATGKIGIAVCDELAAAGYNIALHATGRDNRLDETERRIKEHGNHVEAFGADLSLMDECEKLVSGVCDKLGSIDCFVHCASVFEAMPFETITAQQWDRLMAVDLRAAFFLSQAIGLRMKEKAPGGSIVHFSDVTRDHPYANHIPYCMAKSAIDTMVKGLASALAPRVLVNAIAPYMARHAHELTEDDRLMVGRLPLRRATEPEEIARLIRYLVMENRTMTGQIIVIDGGRSLMW